MVSSYLKKYVYPHMKRIPNRFGMSFRADGFIFGSPRPLVGNRRYSLQGGLGLYPHVWIPDLRHVVSL